VNCCPAGAREQEAAIRVVVALIAGFSATSTSRAHRGTVTVLLEHALKEIVCVDPPA